MHSVTCSTLSSKVSVEAYKEIVITCFVIFFYFRLRLSQLARHLVNSVSVERILLADNTSQQDFGTRKVYCVSNVTFYAESKYAIKIFPSPTAFVQ
jgi:hypothetical protein